MSLDDWHLVFVSVCLILIFAACAPVIMTLAPIREEPFMALAVLGEEGMVEHYYPDDDPEIEVGEEVHWTLYLNNHMGEAQYVSLRMKLLNSTMSAPNSTTCSQSPASAIYEVRRVLLDNGTWIYPFTWSIVDVERVGDFIMVTQLSANKNFIEIEAIAKDGYNFRFVLELWVYDSDLKDFKFGWSSGDELRCAWTQIWFNATSAEY